MVIERALTLDILRGRYAPGSRLPTVRELAVAHDVNPATIQRAVARLEVRGLVEARQGSGLRVHDPAEVTDLSLLPLVLVARADTPAVAAATLADFLTLRRILAARLIATHREALLAEAPALVAAAARVREAAAMGLRALVEADLAFARTVLRATGNRAALLVLNTLARVLDELPEVAEAMYGEPSRTERSLGVVVTAVVEGGAELEATIDAAIAGVDARTVKRFEAALRRRVGAS